LATTDASLKGFRGGFTDGTYGYLVPFQNEAGYHGKVARFSLRTFSDVQVLDVAAIDADLKGFRGAFTDGTYGYIVPHKRRSFCNGKVARFSLQTFGDVQVLDLANTDAGLKGFRDGFTDGTYGYLVPFKNGAGYHGKVARFSLLTFGDVHVLDMATTDADLTGFLGSLTDGVYGYLVAYKNGAGYLGKVARFSLQTFGDNQVLDLAKTDAGLRGFRGGFTDGTYAYLVPYKNTKVARFRVAKTMLTNSTRKTSLILP